MKSAERGQTEIQRLWAFVLNMANSDCDLENPPARCMELNPTDPDGWCTPCGFRAVVLEVLPRMESEVQRLIRMVLGLKEERP